MQVVSYKQIWKKLNNSELKFHPTKELHKCRIIVTTGIYLYLR